MTLGERGPTGDHGQAGDPGRAGEQGKRGHAGPEGQGGVAGERGQAGDTGQVGPAGPRGERGERYSSWLTRNVVRAYVLLAGGLFAFVLVSQWQERQNDERSTEVMARFEAEAIATDRSFCTLANQSRTEINRNREAVRALEVAVRQSYELVVPAADATPIQRQRTNEFRTRILALLDSVKVNGNLDLLDCSGIGNGQLDFSLQDAVTKATTTTTKEKP